MQAAGLIFGGLSSIVGAVGASQAHKYEAWQAERAAKIARVQADQIDTGYREELAGTISNVRAIKAAVGGSPDSPSTLAYIDEEERVSSRGRRIETGSKRMQAAQLDADADYRRRMAKFSLGMGFISALPDFFQAGASL